MKVEASCTVSALDGLGPLYHKYNMFGLSNRQLPGIYELNQKAKEPIIVAYIAYAYAKCKVSLSSEVSFTELFCADGYYAMVAARLGYDRCVGIDNNRDGHFANAATIAAILNLRNTEFVNAEISANSSFEQTDVVANLGGLYHVNSPQAILELSYRMARKYLIVQNVVALNNEDEYYYQSPAPGWTWGNRFNRKSFDRLIKTGNYSVIDRHYNELEGNERAEDRGSVYYLIEKR